MKGNYRLKTDEIRPLYKIKRKIIGTNYWGTVKASSPEEAEIKFRKMIAGTMSKNSAPENRRAAAKRMREKDFEVIDCGDFVCGEQ